jgi:hypothetical protein
MEDEDRRLVDFLNIRGVMTGRYDNDIPLGFPTNTKATKEFCLYEIHTRTIHSLP